LVRRFLPKIGYFELDISNTILITNFDLGLHFIEATFAISEFNISKDELVVMLVPPDTHLRVIVHFKMEVFVGPLVIYGLPPVDGLAFFINTLIVIISKDESVVIDASSFTNTEVFGVSKGKNLHGAGIIIGILVINLHCLLGLEVNDVNFLLFNVADDDFLLSYLPEEVNNVVVLFFKQDLAVCISMDDALSSSGFVHSYENKSSLIGSGRAKNLWELSL
jgi:hypothetical protein